MKRAQVPDPASNGILQGEMYLPGQNLYATGTPADSCAHKGHNDVYSFLKTGTNK